MAYKTYASIIDNILDEPDIAPDYSANSMGDEKLNGDEFLDITRSKSDEGFLEEIAGDSEHTSQLGGGHVASAAADWNHRAARAATSGLFGEITGTLATKTVPTFRFASLADAAKTGIILTTKIKSAAKGEHLNRLVQATARLQRVLAKTPDQMEADGAKTSNDYSNPEIVPGWAKQVRADVTAIHAALTQFLPHASAKACQVFAAYIPALDTVKDTKSDDQALSARDMTEAEVRSHIDDLLNSGVTPKEVAAKIAKMAELQVMNKTLADDYLKMNEGTLGFAYLKPDAYMDSCANTHARMARKMGSIRAHSVKKIAACASCSNFQKSASGARCSLYKLPIVANGAELMPIINNLTKNASGPAAKRAALVAGANRTDQRNDLTVKQPDISRIVPTDYKIGSAEAKSAGRKMAATLTGADMLKLHNAGANVADTYKQAVQKVGSAQANKAVKDMIVGIKQSKATVALTQIDCTMLKGKLATANGIVGEKKCGSCTYRQGMHCGLTGGTLITFEGIEKAASNHKIASGAPKDGTAMVESFGLKRASADLDIDISGPGFSDVEMGFGQINL